MKYLIIALFLIASACAPDDKSASPIDTNLNQCGNKSLFSYWVRDDNKTVLEFHTFKFGENKSYYSQDNKILCEFTLTFSGTECEGVYSLSNVTNYVDNIAVNCSEIIHSFSGQYKKDESGLSTYNETDNIHFFYK